MYSAFRYPKFRVEFLHLFIVHTYKWNLLGITSREICPNGPTQRKKSELQKRAGGKLVMSQKSCPSESQESESTDDTTDPDRCYVFC